MEPPVPPPLPPLPRLRPADEAVAGLLAARLGDDRVDLDPGRRREASRDHAWLSPVLTAALPDVVADVVVTPRDDVELAAALSIAHDHGVAVTPRGKGTGNYGQAVPLAAGLVVDLGLLRGVLDVDDGWLHARAGTSFTRMEAAARATGQELAIFPSTSSSALGGFLSGGAGGTGSIENGWIWDGYVGELTALPCWDVPESQVLDADESRHHLHAYGTTGIVTGARVALRPARRWTALLASFADFTAAAEAGLAIADLDPVPRNLSVDDVALVALLPEHPAMPAGRVSLRAIVDESTVEAARRHVIGGGGRVELVDPSATAMLVGLSFNHVTLRAKRNEPSICHLQVGGRPLVDDPGGARAVLPNGMLHLDAMSVEGRRGYGGLLLSRYVDRPTLWSGVEALRATGVRVTDAHTWAVGGHGDLAPTIAAAERMDPRGLLNPGKLARAA